LYRVEDSDDGIFYENFYEKEKENLYIKRFPLKFFILSFPITFTQFQLFHTTMTTSELPPSLKKSLENSKAEYVRLGKSGLKISVPIMGSMSLGPKPWAPWLIEEEEVSLV
jgi:hypothetical protein